jgi:hypothetical protein
MISENNFETKTMAKEQRSYTVAKVYDRLGMWLDSQNVRATQKVSHTENKQISAVGYILVLAEVVKVSWSLIQHDGEAAFKFSERSPLQPALSEKNLL